MSRRRYSPSRVYRTEAFERACKVLYEQKVNVSELFYRAQGLFSGRGFYILRF